jgi:ADP-ribose pyrophosphatase
LNFVSPRASGERVIGATALARGSRRNEDGGAMKILSIEKVTNEKWVNLFAATFEHNGHQGRWTFASRKKQPHVGEHKADAVVIVPVLREEGKPDRLVMVKEFRVPIGGYSYAFPAGLLEEGEAIEDTVRRELREETGFEVSAIKKVSPVLFSSTGLTDEAAVIAFVDARTTPEAKQHLDHSEDLEVLLLDFGQACALSEKEDVNIDAKAWSVLFLYQQLGQFV